nr:8894_t:CDS:1 [Entrophospora candida]
MIHKLLGYEMNPFSITDNCTADGAILYTVGGGQHALLIFEAKNEIGSGGGDPHRQACGSYGKYLPMVPNCERYLNPCFLLYLAGPWLGISGAFFGKDIIIEPLTPLIPLVPILCHHDRIINILVMFDALKAGLTELKAYYNDVKPDKLDIEQQSHFPYPHSFKNNNKNSYGPICLIDAL